METSLLRALRFLHRFQHERVLSLPEVRLDGGPAWLRPLFRAWPASLVLFALWRQKVRTKRLMLAPGAAFTTNRSTKLSALAARIEELTGLRPSAVVYGRHCTWPVAALRHRRLLTTLGRRRSLRRWLGALARVTRGRHPHVAFNMVALVVAHGNLRVLFAKDPPALVLEVCDLSASRIAAGSAAAACGIPVLYAQQFPHNSYTPPFPAAAALVVDRTAARALREHGALLWQETRGDLLQPPHCRWPPRTIGITPNNFVEAGMLRTTLAALRARFPQARLVLRLHPNSRLQLGPPPLATVIDPPGGGLDAFAGRIDLALAGNSSIMLDLLERRVAVVHMNGIDRMAFDRFGFVDRGIVPGAASVADLDADRIGAFYHDPAWRQRTLTCLDLLTTDMVPARERTAFVEWLRQALDIDRAAGRRLASKPRIPDVPMPDMSDGRQAMAGSDRPRTI